MADPSSKLKARTNPQTRCSNCQTVFEVARELLSSSDTRVRCGECLSIFDALEELRSGEQTDEEQTNDYTGKAADLEQSSGPAGDANGTGNETAALDVTYSDFDIFSEDADLPEIAYFDQTRDTPDFDFDAVEMGNDETFNDYLFAHDVTIDADTNAKAKASTGPINIGATIANAGTDANTTNNKPVGDVVQQNSTYAEVDFVGGENAQEPLIFNYRNREQTKADTAAESKPTNSLLNSLPATPDAIPRAHGSVAKTIDSPAVKLDVGKSGTVAQLPPVGVDSSASINPSGSSNPWILRLGMLALLVVLLGALFAYRTKPQLYNNPTLRPMLEMACNIVRCTLPARVDVASLKMVKRNVYSHPSTPNALVINVSFRNDAEFAQQLPVLHMILSNRVGRVVAKQDFSPNYYMPNWEEGAVINANEQLDVKLEVTDPGQDAQNFEFHFREFKS